MTKPFPPIDNEQIEKRVIITLEDYLRETGGFEITRNPYRMVRPTRKFWEELYNHTSEKDFYEDMINDLAGLSENPLIVFYSGEDVAERIIQKLGQTTHDENRGRDTIRGIFGQPWEPNWRNVVHAPKPKEFEKQRALLWKHQLA